MTPRPRDPNTYAHRGAPRWDDPNGPDLLWPTVALVAAAATWVGWTALRPLLRRLP